ncbi:MAG TPA: YceD family protein [Streptosporangiaceae bacterium]|nr:YceD family protein [Streptosporangiaceae bacterium]
MPQSRKHPLARLDPRKPLVFSTLDLGRSPGSIHSQTATVPAPPLVHAGLAGVPEGSDVGLDLRMAAVSEGVLVTAAARAQVTGECARCLEPVRQQVDVRFQELFAYPADDGPADAEGYALQGDLLDLEPALHDALVLALPLAPLCREDCPGLCVECGAQLAVVGPEHGHDPAIDPRWASLQQAAPGLAGSERDGSDENGNGQREPSAGGAAGPGGSAAIPDE